MKRILRLEVFCVYLPITYLVLRSIPFIFGR